MPISPIFKIQVEQDIERCEGQKAVTGSEELYVELVNRYRTLIENFMRKLPKVRKPPTSICGADYRPELQLIASKLRIYLFAQERGGSEHLPAFSLACFPGLLKCYLSHTHSSLQPQHFARTLAH